MAHTSRHSGQASHHQPQPVPAGPHRPLAGDLGPAPRFEGIYELAPDAGRLHVFPLAQTAEAHRAVQDGAVGNVLIDVTA